MAFESIIGQDHVKTQLNFFLDSYRITNVFPHVMFLSSAGSGKSLFASEIATAIQRKFITINSGSIKNVSCLFDEFFIPFGEHNGICFFFDEIQDLRDDVTAALLTILNPNAHHYNMFLYKKEEYCFDFRRFTFLAAGTEKQYIFKPLLDRFHEIQLAEYQLEDLAEIMKFHAQKDTSIKLNSDALLYLAKFCRSSGRSALLFGQNISRFCNVYKLKEFNKEHAKQIVKIFDLFEYGLTRLERTILQKIADNNGVTLTSLCAKTGMTRQAQQAFEAYLLKHGLMAIDIKRTMTNKGLQYIERNPI